MQLTVAHKEKMLQCVAAAWTHRKKDETTQWWNVNFFKKSMIEAKALKETIRADCTMDLYGQRGFGLLPKWLPELAWSGPIFNFGPHVDLRATPLMTLCRLSLDGFTRSLLTYCFQSQHWSWKGVSLTSSHLESLTPTPLTACQKDWLTKMDKTGMDI